MPTPAPLRIETWYDRHTRSWVSQVINGATGEQVGDALYDGNKADRDASRRHLRSQIKSGAIR